jgi:hypothetical protein
MGCWKCSRAGLAVLLIVATLVVAVGCGAVSGRGPGAAGATSAGSEGATATAAGSVSATVGAPRFPERGFTLDGAFKVADHTERTALLVRDTGDEYPSHQLYVMDLGTGRTRRVLDRPVNESARWEVLGYKLSDRWVVWEEVSPGETEADPRLVSWKLYAARVDDAGSDSPPPTLIDEGCLADRARPLFGLYGDRLVYAANDLAGTDPPNSVVGVVRSRDLAGGQTRVLLRQAPGIGTLSVSGPTAIVTYSLTASGPCAVRCIDIASGATSATIRLPGSTALSHFPAWHDGWLAWASFAKPGDADTTLFLREPGGGVTRLGASSIDACFAGEYVFYEASSSRSATSGVRGAYTQIWGMRLGESRRFLLAEDDAERRGWWQTVLAIGYREAAFVIAEQVGQERDVRTVIRVYDVSGRRTKGMRP